MSSDEISPPERLSAVLLGRYLSGTATAEERAQVEAWRRAAPLHDVVTDALQTRALQGMADAQDVELVWRQIHARAMASAPSTMRPVDTQPRDTQPRDTRPLENQHGRRRPALSRALRSHGFPRLISALAAAVGAAIVVVGGYALHTRESHRTPHVYSTEIAQHRTVTLADGSVVTLAPQTRLTVGAAFGQVDRTVTLVGEAYFDVAHANGRPFVVVSGRVATRVLGTVFDVASYPNDTVTRVAVTTGKVAIGARATHVLTPGMVAYVTDSTTRVVTDADAQNYTAWVAGHLVFKEVPMREVAATLRRWYGLEFRYADSTLANRHITAVFDYDAQSDALRTLQLMLGVRMTFHGNVVTLIPGRVEDSIPQSRRGMGDPTVIPTEVGR